MYMCSWCVFLCFAHRWFVALTEFAEQAVAGGCARHMLCCLLARMTRISTAMNFLQVSDMLKIKRWKVQEYHRIAIKSLRSDNNLVQLAHAL